jgi:alpha-galactosidase
MGHISQSPRPVKTTGHSRKTGIQACLVVVLAGLRFLAAPLTMAEPLALEKRIGIRILSELADVPWSFNLAGQPAAQALADWRCSKMSEPIGAGRRQHTVIYTDPATSLELRCVAIEYLEFPVIEWTLHFMNGGVDVSPVISDLRPLDLTVRGKTPEQVFVLHHAKGSRAERDDYRPYRTVLEVDAPIELASIGGRPTNGGFPYFNLADDEGGLVLALGWPGQWCASFRRDLRHGVKIRGGQTDSHFMLRPGEGARSPLVALLHYRGDWIDGQNLWRRWMLAHNVPKVRGDSPTPQLLACSSHQFNEMLSATEKNQTAFIDRYIEERLPLAAWWMDAGWYVNDGTWVNTGTWEIDRGRFPNGLRPITDHAHNNGIDSIVWYEPERVTKGSWLDKHYHQWCIGAPPNPGGQQFDDDWLLLNLGNPEAQEWLVQHIGDMIESAGIDWYRQDFNMDPLLFWRSCDDPNRLGITEIRHVSGYLAFWDALLRRHPHLRIDTCASGGRRNDLETLRRAVPLLRSDFLFEPVSQQCHHFGIAFWIPYHGTGTHIGPSAIGLDSSRTGIPYSFRSHLSPSITACWDMRSRELDYNLLRRMTGQFMKIAPNLLGDFYPLTDYSTADDTWIAWQYNLPDEGEGVVQAFRRKDASEDVQIYRLRGLEPDAHYEIKDLDTLEVRSLRGSDLMASGLSVHLREPESAALLTIQKKGLPVMNSPESR